MKASVVEGALHLEDGGQELVSLPIVPANEQHRSYILATWVRSYLPTARRFMSKDLYLKEEAKVAEKLWKYSLVVSSDGFAVQAWVCTRGDGVLHHCYVVPELRRKGIMKALTRTFVGDKVQVSRPWPGQMPAGWVYNPYRIGG